MKKRPFFYPTRQELRDAGKIILLLSPLAVAAGAWGGWKVGHRHAQPQPRPEMDPSSPEPSDGGSST